MPRWDTSNEALRKAVRWAMLDAWLWTAKKNIRGAAIAPPDDFRRVGGEIKFVPGEFADRVAELLLTRGLKVDGCDDDDEEEEKEISGAEKVDDAGTAPA